MGYLLNNIFETGSIIVPQADISNMGVDGFKIFETQQNYAFVLLTFYIQTINSTEDYEGYGAVFISNFKNAGFGTIYAFANYNTDALNSSYVLNMICYSAPYKYGDSLYLRFNRPATFGNGDFLCTYIYKSFTEV